QSASRRAAKNPGEAGDRAGAWNRREPCRGEQRTSVGRIVAAADVMRHDHDLGTAAGLVDAPVLHDVREPRLRPVGVAGLDADDEVAEIRVEDAGLRERCPETPRLFERERRREAVAILRGIGKHLPAAVTRVARGWTKE